MPHPNATSTRWRLLHAASAIAWIAHLALPDAAQPGWAIPNVAAYLALPLLLTARAPALAYALLTFAAVIPLLTAGDVLTQSTLLAIWAASACVAHLARQPDLATITWRITTAATYSLATLHKLNSGWLHPDTSCANYGLLKLLDYLHLPHTWLSPIQSLNPLAILALEASISLGLLTRRHRLVWPITILFHISMTLTLAPAFALVMLAGHAAFLTSEDINFFYDKIKIHHKKLLTFALIMTVATCLAHRGPPDDLTMLPREALLWLLLAITWPTSLKELAPQPHPIAPEHRRGATIATAAAILFFAQAAASPYLGLKVQHSAAMLSNLRIDHGCWNHLFIPERVRLREDYIRIDEATLGAPERHPSQRHALTSELWDLPRLRRAAKNWCKAQSARPIALRGTFQHQPFTIDDLCQPHALDELSSRGGALGQPELFPHYLRFQKNLPRTCPAACIH